MYVQINIGRNIGTIPMDIHTWLSFQGDVLIELEKSALSVPASIFVSTVEVHTGTGRWFDHETGEFVSEDSAKISFFDPAGFDLDTLRTALGELKLRYSQDNIALITGSELI